MSRDRNLTLIAHLKTMKSRGTLKPYTVTITDTMCTWRHKDNSVTMLPLDGSYVRIINPSWYEGDQLKNVV